MRALIARGLPFVLLLVTGLAAGAGGLLGHRESLTPHAFSEAGPAVVGIDAPARGSDALGQPVWFGMTYPDLDVVARDRDDGRRARISEARPRVVQNTAQAKIELVVCVIDRAANVGSLLAAPDRRALDDTCSETFPVGQRPLRLSGGFPDQVLAKITPRRPGVVQLDGLDVTYSYGGRDGTEHVGLGVQLGG